MGHVIKSPTAVHRWGIRPTSYQNDDDRIVTTISRNFVKYFCYTSYRVLVCIFRMQLGIKPFHFRQRNAQNNAVLSQAKPDCSVNAMLYILFGQAPSQAVHRPSLSILPCPQCRTHPPLSANRPTVLHTFCTFYYWHSLHGRCIM